MQSSSKLFPVQLVSAELVGNVVEDVYLLKPNSGPDHSVQISVTRVSNRNEDHTGQPIVLLHGLFSSCRYWLAGDGKGIAAGLVEAGYDVWVPELRGHGLSPINNTYDKNSVDAFVNSDLPAIHQFIVEQTGNSVTWVGEGLGGFLIGSALALSTIDQGSVSKWVYIEEQKPLSNTVDMKVYSKKALWRFKKGGIISGRPLGLGSENEVYYVVREYLRWQIDVSYERPAGLALDNTFKNISVPTMIVGSQEYQLKQGRVRRSKWLYEQISSNAKLFREYDYRKSQRRIIYDDGGATISSEHNGIWDDILGWLKEGKGLVMSTEESSTLESVI